MKSYRPFVLTSALVDQDQFPFDAVYCSHQRFAGGRPGIWKIVARKIYEALTHSQKRFYTKIITDQKAQLLHAHFGTEGYYHLGIQRKTGLPLITTFYGADVSKLPQDRPKWRKRYRRLFEIGSLFLAEGPYMAHALIDLGCPPQKVRVQHLGVDVQRIQFIPRYLDKGEPVRILMTCSFRQKKGIPYAIQAFALSTQKYSNMELRIIGGANTPEEKNLMERCRKIAVNQGIADKVNFLGFVPYSDYLKETTSAHIFLAPSVRAMDGDTEGGVPVAVIEASAAGMPVIATWHCDIPNVIIDGETGVLVPERDVESLAEAIVTISGAPESWPIMGKAGRNRIEREFDVFKQILRLENIYAEFI